MGTIYNVTRHGHTFQRYPSGADQLASSSAVMTIKSVEAGGPAAVFVLADGSAGVGLSQGSAVAQHLPEFQQR